MSKIRVHELAAELRMDSRLVLRRLQELGEFVKGPSSMIEAPVAKRVRDSFGAKAPSTVQSPSDLPGAPIQLEEPRQAFAFDSTTPSARQFGWRAGAIPAPQHPDLLNNIEKVSRQFPEFRDHVAALRQLGSQVVYAGVCRENGFGECAVVLVRFSGAIESGFGFTREVMLFYSPHPDLQGRTFNAALRELKSIQRSVTPDVFFMSSPDPRLQVKLNDWSSPSRLAIPLLIDDEDELSLITLLRDYLYTRDLFYETTPVYGANFFGRKTLLQTLRDDVLHQRVTGIFGLRKAGKTSILMQLKEQLLEDNVVTVLIDLEAFPSPPEDPTDDIVADLRRRLLEEFRLRDLRTRELAELSDRPSILELKNALQSILKRLHKDGHRVLLLLDEIEYLTPADRIDVAEGDMPRVAQLLSALRSIVQETENFTFLLSGLTSAIVESGRLYGRPNPLFSWAKGVYVGPLDRQETDNLANAVGGKMGIRIDQGALGALHEASGGHAFLYRSLSSAVVDTLPKDVFQRTMARSSVLRELMDWRTRIRGNIEEMIHHVKRYYPTEAVMLEILMESPEDFAELAGDEQVAVRRLKDLGLIRESAGEFEVNEVLELL